MFWDPSLDFAGWIFSDPSLHFQDISKLLIALNALVDKGHSVVIIEHNLEIIRTADWVIDLGPEGGEAGGQIVATGSVADIIKAEASYTGQYLKRMLE